MMAPRYDARAVVARAPRDVLPRLPHTIDALRCQRPRVLRSADRFPPARTCSLSCPRMTSSPPRPARRKCPAGIRTPNCSRPRAAVEFARGSTSSTRSSGHAATHRFGPAAGEAPKCRTVATSLSRPAFPALALREIEKMKTKNTIIIVLNEVEPSSRVTVTATTPTSHPSTHPERHCHSPRAGVRANLKTSSADTVAKPCPLTYAGSRAARPSARRAVRARARGATAVQSRRPLEGEPRRVEPASAAPRRTRAVCPSWLLSADT